MSNCTSTPVHLVRYRAFTRDSTNRIMRSRTVPPVILLTLLLSANLAHAQSVSISGTVRDAQDRSPLIGASVILIGAGIGDATDEDGRYVISNVTAGTYIIRAGYIGYTSVSDTLIVTGETDIERDFEMSYTMLEGEEIIVTAQAKGQMDAINRQLAEKSLVNIVSSDRIEELPDANAAESVARIPGVTVQREGGEGNKVVIRGLSPKYNALSVNGVRLAATDSSDRSTDLSMVSQYMLKGIEVTKAGTPNQDADVLGGTVNFKLKTAEPGFHINALAQGMYNGLRQSYQDYKLVLEVSNRFFKNRLGLLGLIDLENRDRSSHELSASYDNPNAQLDSLNALRTTGISLFDITRKNDRLNGLLVADFDLPEGNVSYSFLNSSINTDQTTFFESYALATGGRIYNSGWGDRKITVNTHILEFSHTLFSKFHIDASVSLSKSTQDFNRFVARFREHLAFTKLVLGVNVNSVQDFLKNDLATVYADGYSINRDANDETEAAARLDLGYDFRVFKYLSGAIRVGAKYRKKAREYDKGVESGRLDYVWQPAMDSLLVAFPRVGEFGFPGVRRLPYAAFIGEDYKEGDFLNGDFALGPFADLDLLKDISDFLTENFSYATYWEEIAHTFHQTNSNLFDYSGEETYTASYVMADVDIGSKFNVVAGVRWERNKTVYDSWQGWQNVIPSYTFAGFENVTRERTNEFLLPALFLRYRPVRWLELRFARTHTLARPNYADFLPLYNIAGANRSVTYRNPFLKPALSRNIDASISVIQNHIGFFSVGYFQKNIDDLIFSSGRRYIVEAEPYGLPEEIEKGFIQNYVSNNPHDVLLRGFEFDYQTRFWYLPGFLSGLVFNANYTVTNSEVKYPRTIIEFEIDFGPPLRVTSINRDTLYVDRLIDQPDQIMNFAIGYDYKGFSARVSMLYRSDIFRKTNFWPELRESSDGFRRWDLSLKQSLPVRGLDVYLNVSNITASEDVNRFLNESRFVGLRQNYGRTIDLGVRYRF